MNLSQQLYSLYLHPQNFSSVATPLYIDSASSSPFIRLSTSLSLQRAAATSITDSSPSGSHSSSVIIDADAIRAEANEAFDALETLLGADEWFFGAKRPGLMDAAVFAYTFLCGEGSGLEWRENVLGDMLRKREGLVRHRARILEGWMTGLFSQDELRDHLAPSKDLL